MPATERRTRQRSLRLAEGTLRLLDSRSKETAQSSNRLAQRLLDEALRTDRHPLIVFREGASGRRRPSVIGTRIDVAHVIASLRASRGSVKLAAGYLGIPETQVRACVSYYAEFKDEVDAFMDEEREVAQLEEERWQREQQVID